MLPSVSQNKSEKKGSRDRPGVKTLVFHVVNLNSIFVTTDSPLSRSNPLLSFGRVWTEPPPYLHKIKKNAQDRGNPSLSIALLSRAPRFSRASACGFSPWSPHCLQCWDSSAPRENEQSQANRTPRDMLCPCPVLDMGHPHPSLHSGDWLPPPPLLGVLDIGSPELVCW